MKLLATPKLFLKNTKNACSIFFKQCLLVFFSFERPLMKRSLLMTTTTIRDYYEIINDETLAVKFKHDGCPIMTRYTNEPQMNLIQSLQ